LTRELDPELYPPDPEVFRPERFPDGAPPPYTWIFFGGGVRRCLGAAFAQLEMKVVISKILRRARLRAPTLQDEALPRSDDAPEPRRRGPDRENRQLTAGSAFFSGPAQPAQGWRCGAIASRNSAPRVAPSRAKPPAARAAPPEAAPSR
jgi:cytochrome P450